MGVRGSDLEHPRPRPNPTAPLRTEVVTGLDQLAALADRWQRLLLISPGATAFASPAWLLTWYRHVERPGGLHAVTVWSGEELVGLAPFARTHLGGRPAGRGAFELLVSAGTEHGDYGDPLLGPDPAPVAAAVADHLAGLVRRGRTVVNVRRLRDDDPLLAALTERDDVTRAPMGQVAVAAVVRFDQLDDPAGYLHRLARRHQIPRRMRRLRERYDHVTYTADDPEIDAALDAMEDLLSRRWGPGEGPPLFATPGRAALTRAIAHALRAAGLGRVSTLTVDGRPVAVSTALQVGTRHVSDNAAFDPDLAPYGLGQAELHAMLEDALASGATEVDLRAGDFPYKRKWANAERRTRSLVLAAPGAAGRRALAIRRLAMSVRARRLRHRLRRPPG